MTAETIDPEEAHRRIHDEGVPYLDVRTTLEFHQGHPSGAYNIPVLKRGPQGLAPNPSFVDEVTKHFDQAAPLIVGCKMGGRSRQAAALLSAAGFQKMIDMPAGFDGKRDPFGRATVEGWKARGLPVSTDPDEGRDYASLGELEA